MAQASLHLTNENREIIRLVGLTIVRHLSGGGFDSALKAHFLVKTKASKKSYDSHKTEIKKTENKIQALQKHKYDLKKQQQIAHETYTTEMADEVKISNIFKTLSVNQRLILLFPNKHEINMSVFPASAAKSTTTTSTAVISSSTTTTTTSTSTKPSPLNSAAIPLPVDIAAILIPTPAAAAPAPPVDTTRIIIPPTTQPPPFAKFNTNYVPIEGASNRKVVNIIFFHAIIFASLYIFY